MSYSTTITCEMRQLFDRLIYQLYIPYPSRYHGPTHISRTMVCSLVLLRIYEFHTQTSQDHLVPELLFSTLFHDAGRQGRDGTDYWENESADIAKTNLEGFSKAFIENVYNSIANPKQTCLLDVLSKGADSFEIVRVDNYDVELNALYRFMKRQNLQVKECFEKLAEEQLLVYRCFRFLEKVSEKGDWQGIPREVTGLLNKGYFTSSREGCIFTDTLEVFRVLRPHISIYTRWLGSYWFS